MALTGETRKDLCYGCKEPKAGTTIGEVGGVGFGQKTRKAPVQICINPKCEEGRRNLAGQKTA